VTEIPTLDGAEVGGRICAAAVAGFAAVREILTSYDGPSMRFSYKATEGQPWFITSAENSWSVSARGTEACLVESQAVLEMAWLPGVFFAPLFKVMVRRVIAQFFEDLKHYAQHDRPSSRKQRAQQKSSQ